MLCLVALHSSRGGCGGVRGQDPFLPTLFPSECVYGALVPGERDRKSTRLNSSHVSISYAVFCLKKKRRPPESRPRGCPLASIRTASVEGIVCRPVLFPGKLG